MRSGERQAKPAAKLSIIDALSAGLALVPRVPRALIMPVLLDLFYWLGPRLSVEPILQSVIGWSREVASSASTTDTESLEVMENMLRVIGSEMNLFSVLSSSLTGVPTLTGIVSSPSTGLRSSLPQFELHTGLAFFAALVGLTILGWLLGSGFLVLIAERVLAVKWNLPGLLRRIGLTWLSVIGLGGLLFVATIFFGVPILILIVLVGLMSRELASILFGLVWTIVIWVAIHLIFAVDAIVLNGVNPVRGMWHSFNVVRRNFWSSLGLILVIGILSAGLAVIWQALAVNPIGTLIGIVGNTIIGT
ncbi:MAG: hypothetical protein A2Z04_09860, partial [Chloroflexi bacterium RBG_16_57_9]